MKLPRQSPTGARVSVSLDRTPQGASCSPLPSRHLRAKRRGERSSSSHGIACQSTCRGWVQRKGFGQSRKTVGLKPPKGEAHSDPRQAKTVVPPARLSYPEPSPPWKALAPPQPALVHNP